MEKDPNHTEFTPPKLWLRFLHWFCDPLIVEDVEGDLTELFKIRATTNLIKAKFLFAKDILLLFRPGIIRNIKLFNSLNSFDMLFNHLQTAFRQLYKHKGYALINLSGLVVGLASCILILLWVADELSMDRFHSKTDRIYQVWRNMYQADGSVSTTAGVPQPLEIVLREEYPEVEDVTTLSWEMEFLFRIDEKTSYETGRYASPGFFQVFSFPLIAGNPLTALNDVHAVVISERLAKKYFGEEWAKNAIGQLFKIDEREQFTVTGIFKEPGSNSSLAFDWIIPAQEYIQRNEWVESWYNGGFRIFISTKEGVDIQSVQAKVESEVNDHTNNEANELIYLQLFADNYLNATFENGLPVGGRIQYVNVLIAIAIFILLIACINFMNLATARSSTRAKEIGVRKVMGAHRGNLSQQFFAESFLHSFFSMTLALVIVYFSLPYFNAITGKQLVIDFSNPLVWAFIVGMTFITGMLSGSYPAIMLSSFTIIKSLKGLTKRGKGAYFRNGLVTFQFAISIFLICSTIVVSKQMDYILSKDLGLDKENVIMIEQSGTLANNNEVYKNGLQEVPQVKNITFTSGNPLSYGSSTSGARWEGKNPDDVVEINVLSVDADFLETMGMDLLEGKDFTNNFSADSAYFLINEVLAEIMGFDTPVGRSLSVWGTDGSIIGVIRNFHMDSMYEPIAPLIIRYDPGNTRVAFIRTQGNTQQAIVGIEEVTKKLNPAFPFRYYFLDEEYSKRYQGEKAVSTLVNIFAFVSILISCLGLLGLSSFTADQRAKEIGIRKVHGATSFKLVMILSQHYAKLMVVAFLIAAPISYYYMQNWLTTFAFRTDPGYMLFVFAGMIAFALGISTVSYKSYQAAVANPIKTLKED